MILVFLSPESLQLPVWRDTLSNSVFKKRLALVAIDEAHCIVERSGSFVFCPIYYVECCIRGKDFRTAFDRMGGVRALVDVPFMALTASAPPEIEATIVSSLQLNNPVIVHCDLDRPNIYFSCSPIKTLNVSKL